MDTIKIKRGDQEVTFTKSPTSFGVRLKKGRARDERALETTCGTAPGTVRHLDSVAHGDLELFSVIDGPGIEEAMGQLRKAEASEVVSHVYSIGQGGNESMVVPTGALLVAFKPEVVDEVRQQILAAHGLEVVEELDYLPHAFTVRLTGASRENPLKIASRLQSRPEVTVAEPDLGFRMSQKSPSDPVYAQQWHLNNRGGSLGLKAGADVKAEAAWLHTRGKREVVVCVIDDGFDLAHPDFQGDGKVVAPFDFGQSDPTPSPVEATDNHGTACAGVAIAEENGSGVVGLAPRCAFMPVRMANWLTDESITAMFRHAMDKGASVISCSWSAATWNFPLSTRVTAILRHVATVGRGGKGCVILFAAGNEDRPLRGTKDGQVSHQGFALHPDVIAVAASNSLDARSSYSNYGDEIAFCAPSSGAPGRGIVTTDRVGTAGYGGTSYTTTFGGTSSATPLAAGLAALILSVRPDLTSREVKEIMMATADKIDADHAQYVNGRSKYLGAGRINAEAALLRALGRSAGREETLVLEHRVAKPIRDLAQTADVLEFPSDVVVGALEVNLDIRHGYVSDLKIVLEGPLGHKATLHDRAGGSESSLALTLRSATHALLTPFVGTKAKGRWTLRIDDLAKDDDGSLVKWSLGVGYTTPA